MKKLAIVVGHNSESQGATRKDTGESEYIWNGRLAAMISDLGSSFGLDVEVFRRTAGGSYLTEIERVYAQTDAWGAEASIELHFNGADDPTATGTEVLTSGTPSSMRMAVAVQEEMVSALGLRDRGIHTRRSGRGSGSLMSGRAPAILVEPFFGSSPKGQVATDDHMEMVNLARAILRGAARAMDAMPRSDISSSRTIEAANKAELRTKQTCGGILGLVGVDTLPGAVAALSEAQGKLSSLLPVLRENLPVLIIGGIALAVYFKGPEILEAIRKFREEDHRKELR